MRTSAMTTAGIGSHPRFDAKSAYEIVRGYQKDVSRILFPYFQEEQNKKNETTDYDAYFDELDRIVAERKKSAEGSAEIGAESVK